MKKKKPGRPPFKIDNALLKKTKGLAARGLTQQQIADSLGIEITTLHKYKNLNTDFNKAIREGKALGIAEVANSLFNTATGGNVAAQIFYMKNRAGWADKQEVDMAVTKVKTLEDFYKDE
jgi:transcriptional regulator with XRE-family HTH domain